MSTITAPQTSTLPPPPLVATPPTELLAQNAPSKPALIGKLSFGNLGYVNLLKLGDGTIGVQSADPKRAGASKVYTLRAGSGDYAAKFVFPMDLQDAKKRVQQLVSSKSISLFKPSAPATTPSNVPNLGDLGGAVLSGLSGKPLTARQKQAVNQAGRAIGQIPVAGIPLNQIPKIGSGVASTVNRVAKAPVLPTGDPASSLAHARAVANKVIAGSGSFHSLADLAGVPGSADVHPELAAKVAQANQLRAKINQALQADPGAASGGYADWKTLLTPAEHKKLDGLQAADKADRQVQTSTTNPAQRQNFFAGVSGSVLETKGGATFLPAEPVTARTPLSTYSATQITRVTNGQHVTKGQVLADVSSPTLDNAEREAKQTLSAEKSNASAAFRQYQTTTAPQQAQLKNSDAAIAAAQKQVQLQQSVVSRYTYLVQQGAVAPVQLENEQKTLETAKQNLATQIQSRDNLRAQIQTQSLPPGLTEASFIAQAEAGKLGQTGSARYPDTLIAAGTKVFNAKQKIDELAAARESMTLRAPRSGIVTSVQIASSATTTGGGSSTTTLDGKSGAYGLGFTVVPEGPPGLLAEQVDPKNAQLFRNAQKNGGRVAIQDPITGRFGTAQVGSVSESPTATEGYRVVLKNARIDNKPIDPRAQYRVYSSNREAATLASRDSKNVSYAPPSAVVANVDKLPAVTQVVDVAVPVFSKRTKQQIGDLKVKLVGTTDGQTIKLDATQTQAFFVANSGKNAGVPIAQSISPNAIVSLVGPSLTGAKTGVQGSAALFSMQSIVIPDATTKVDSTANGNSRQYGVSGTPGGVGLSFSTTFSNTDTKGRSIPGAASSATASFEVVPTGGGLQGQGGNAIAVIGLPSKIEINDPARP